MKESILAISKRISVIATIAVLILAQTWVVSPEVKAADGSLEVRIQYEAWRGDKIPTKAVFSSEELLGIGSQIYQYTNVTDVATLMRTVARGPKLSDVISAAGIDRSSVKYVIFRTVDGNGKDGRYSMKLSPWQYESDRMYYPNLAGNYERNNEEGTIKPNEGSLSDASHVPAIMAVDYYSTKTDRDSISKSKLSRKSLLRFCLGQTPIDEGKWTDSGYSGDVTSEESIQDIYGIDVILTGAPPEDEELNVDDKNVGSKGSKGGGKSSSSSNANKVSDETETQGILARELVLGEAVKQDDPEELTDLAEVSALGNAENYGRGAVAGTIGSAAAACIAGFVLRLRKFRIDK